MLGRLLHGIYVIYQVILNEHGLRHMAGRLVCHDCCLKPGRLSATTFVTYQVNLHIETYVIFLLIWYVHDLCYLFGRLVLSDLRYMLHRLELCDLHKVLQ